MGSLSHPQTRWIDRNIGFWSLSTTANDHLKKINFCSLS